MQIDHLVFCVPHLNNAILQFEKILKVPIFSGGRHIGQGTKNAIIPLKDQAYLELLAVDRKNPYVDSPRWMGVDKATTTTLSRWCLKTNDLNEKARVLRNFDPQLSLQIEGSREMKNGDKLRWRMIKPHSSPQVEITPFFVDWSGSAVHPSQIVETDLSISKLELMHPSPNKYASLFQNLNLDLEITSARAPKIRVHLNTPSGEIIL